MRDSRASSRLIVAADAFSLLPISDVLGDPIGGDVLRLVTGEDRRQVIDRSLELRRRLVHVGFVIVVQ